MTTTTNPAKPHDTSGTPSGCFYLDTSSKTSVDGQLNATLVNGACEFNDLQVVEKGKEEVLEGRNWGNYFRKNPGKRSPCLKRSASIL
jgi:hypothetical protein